MTNEELLNNRIYCPNKINISIIAYLELEFGILLCYNNCHIILWYCHDFNGDYDLKKFISVNNLCRPENINTCYQINKIDPDAIDIYVINNTIALNIYINQNVIIDLKNYILTNYGN